MSGETESGIVMELVVKENPPKLTICPLFALSARVGKGDECIRDLCAWWVRPGRCAVADIPYMVAKIVGAMPF